MILPKRSIRAAFARSAQHYAQYDAAQRRIARLLLAQLLERFAALPPLPILDAGCGVGRDFALLAKQFSSQPIFGIDAALPLLVSAKTQAIHSSLVVGDLEALPFADRSFGLYWSNCAWQWSEPEKSVAEAHRVLTQAGVLAVGLVVAGTFPELAQAALSLGEEAPLTPLPAAATWRQVLTDYPWQQLTLTPVSLTLFFATPEALLASIRGVGASTTVQPRRFDRQRRARLTAALAAQTTAAGIPLTYEVLLVTASCSK